MRIVILGLSITSSWGNGHATTYRALTAGLRSRGHDVLFLERDVPWYAGHRDLERSSDCRIGLYRSLRELDEAYRETIATADLVMIGSYVPDGIAVAERVLRDARGVTAYYDIDTPVTVAAVAAGTSPHITRGQMPRFDLYLSFTGGPILDRLQSEFDVPRPRPFYCSVDPQHYQRQPEQAVHYDLGYLGTYSADRQAALERLLLGPALHWPNGRFIIAGAQYPATMMLPSNVDRVLHLAPPDHAAFYSRQRFTLNITRREMVHAGYSPSVRLFEAAACGTPVISDDWAGLDTFLAPGREVLIAHRSEDVLMYLNELSETERVLVGLRARHRVLASHTAQHRATELERYVAEVAGAPATRDVPLDAAHA